jgi:hypothetical protein
LFLWLFPRVLVWYGLSSLFLLHCLCFWGSNERCNVFSTFPCSDFIALCLRFRPLIHLGWFFVHGKRRGSKFMLLNVLFNFASIAYSLLFLHTVFMIPMSNTSYLGEQGLIGFSSVSCVLCLCFYGSTLLFNNNSCVVCFEISDILMPPALILLLLPMIALAITDLGLKWFHMNFRIFFSISVKRYIGILMENASNL